MVKEIRIYIEGCGDSKNTKGLLRQGFSSFFNPIGLTLMASETGFLRESVDKGEVFS